MNTTTVRLIGNILKFLTIVVGLVLIVMVLNDSADLDIENLGWEYVAEKIGGSLGGALWVCYIGIFFLLAVMIVFGLLRFVTNLKGNVGTLVGVGIMVAIGIFCYYGLSDGSEYARYGEDATLENTKWSGAGIYFLYFLAGGTVLAVLYAEVSKLLK